MRALVAFGTAALVTICGALPAASARAAAPAMSLELARLDGASFVRLDDFPDRPVLLNFWGSECPACVRELPLLLAQARRHPELQFLGIATDDKTQAKRFLLRQPSAYPQLISGPGTEVVMRRFGNRTGALPFTAILDVQHRICATHLGEIEPSWIDAAARTCGSPPRQRQDEALPGQHR